MSYVDRPSPPPRFSLGPPVLLLVVLLGVLWWRFGPSFWKEGPLHNPAAQLRAPAPAGDRLTDEQNTIQIFKEDFPGVALITPLAMRTNVYTGAVQETPRGTGSGFVWDTNGNIVTNFHVIQSAEGAQVLLPTFKEPFKARLVGVDPNNDLAVLKIDAPAEQLKPLPIAKNEELEVGQKALAIGNPFGLSGTLTVGHISALNRVIQSVTDRPIQGVIQTDAAINPGNSGGPLLDSSGRVIGVNTAISSPTGANAGIGFAIPIDTVNRVVTALIQKGHVDSPTTAGRGPRLGVVLWPREDAHKLGIDSDLLIRSVVPDGAAAKAGLRPSKIDGQGRVRLGDAILALDDEPVNTVEDLRTQLDRHQVGHTIEVTVLRDGNRFKVPVTLQAQ